MKNLKCPNCGGILEVMDEESGKVKCPYCDYVGTEDDYKETHHDIYTDTAKVEEAKTERYRYERMFDHIEKQEAAKEAAAQKKTRMILAGIMVALLVFVSAFLIHTISHRNDIKIRVSSSDLVGTDISEVTRTITEAGLANIESVGLQDLTNENAALENQVTRVSIDGISSFKKNSWFSKGSTVMIEYHTLDPNRNDVQIGTSSTALIGERASAVTQIISSAGLVNIENIELKDLTNKDAAMEYKVTKVTINGVTQFDEKTWFPKDSKVMIEYHLLDPNRPDEIKVPGGYSKYIGENYEDVQRAFEEAGFANINLDPRADVSMISKERGQVTEVYVDGKSDFSDDTWVEKTVKVRITFHSTKGDEKGIIESKAAKEYELANEGNILMPQAAKKYVGKNYEEVANAIRDLGFDNIELVPLGDIKKDILRQENDVDEISINGDSKFKAGVYFEPNASVVIKYHSRTE